MIAYREKLTLPTFSPQEYLAYERHANSKHEYFEGNIIAMPGSLTRHNEIVSNLLEAFFLMFARTSLRFRVLTSDQRVKVGDQGPYFYPDITVAPLPLTSDEDDCLHNPAIIVEVLSRSTSSFDRNEKFEAYRQIPSLQNYLLIAQDRVCVEHFVRHNEDRWELVNEFEQLEETIRFTDLGTSITVAEIYQNITVI